MIGRRNSQWIAYAQQEENKMQTIYLYSAAGKETHAVTDGWFDSFGPAFSANGKYLFLIFRPDLQSYVQPD